jgi:hypothetical protein
MAERFTKNFEGTRHKGVRMGTLWCSRRDLDGDVTLSTEVDEWDWIEKLDFLQDVIGLLSKEYDITLNPDGDRLKPVRQDADARFEARAHRMEKALKEFVDHPESFKGLDDVVRAAQAALENNETLS